jgi:hypothetical protein
MAYGTVKVDNITFDDGGSDQNVTVSGLYNSLTSGITVTGTISGAVVIGSTSVSGTTVAGVTVTGTTVQGASGTFTSLTGTTIQGTTATYTTGSFTSLTGTTIQGTTATYTTGSFTSITGTTTTGTTANFASGVFTTSVSGTTVIASTGTFTSLTGTTTQGTTATYTTGSFTSLTGTTTTGTTSSFTSGVFTTLSGATATFTSGIIASGTAAAPSLAILGDPDTGVFSPGANQLAVATNGTGRLFINSTGLVGINNSNPQYQLDLNQTGTTSLFGAGINANLDGGDHALKLTTWGNTGGRTGSIRFITGSTTGGAERLRITYAGLVGIGTSAPSSLLHVQGSDIGIFVKSTNSSGSSKLLFGNDLVNEAQIFYNGSTKGTFGGNGALTIYHGGNKPILFATANTERIRIDGSGRLLVGTSAGYGVASSGLARFQVGSTAADIHASLTDWSNLNQGGVIAFGAARGGAVGDYTIVQDGDNLGSIRFAGADGTDLQSQGASIAAQVDGTPGANDMPGRLTFSTTADGASTPTERLRITSAGLVGIGLSTDIGATLHVDPSTNVTAGFGAPLIKVGGANSWGSTGSLYSIGFGYNNGSTVKSPAEIGLATTSTAGVTKGDLVFATRDVTTDTAPIERLRIDSSGRLLVGTSTSPSSGNGQFAPLVVQGYIGGSTSLAYLSLQRGEAASSITADEGLGAITFGDNAGNTFAQVAVAADGTAGSGDYPGRLTFSTTADGASTPTERMRITNGGSILCDSTTIIGGDTAPLQADGKTRTALALKGGSNGFFAAFYNTSSTLIGSITGAGGATTFYNTSSDYRIKENVVPLTEAISRVNQLQVHRFNFISHPDQTVDGFIAHEAQEVVPECVTGTKDAVDADGNPVMQGIDQSKLVPLLTAALQEAIGEIESLKARVTALES